MLHLYHLSLQTAQQTTCQITGSFMGAKGQEVLIAKQDRLQLIKPDSSNGRLKTIHTSEPLFGKIRALVPFRLTGATKDHVVVASDSGRIVILEYDTKSNCFVKVHQETYGKTGCRRVVPGQYLAVDPKGRACMIAAVEKQKLVYILNRDASANLTISSPLEAHKSHSILFDVVGLDVEYDNPIFACLELDYGEVDQDPTGEALENCDKLLTYYELDLGLNHVIRKWSEPVDPRANMLVAVPGGKEGPSGVLVCSENWISYRHQDQTEHRVPIPRRKVPGQDSDRGLLIVASALHKMKSEDGDIYKVTLNHENGDIKELKIKYFDTLPVSVSLTILKSGFIVASPEGGNLGLYQFIGLGDGTDELEFSSSKYTDMDDATVYFQPRELTNLSQTDEMESIAPLIDAKVVNLTGEDAPQIYSLCGKGSNSTFRILRYGLEVSEVGAMPLPGNPTEVWTVKLGPNDTVGAYVLSFSNATLVLTMGENPEEVQESGIMTATNTLNIQQLDDGGFVQIYPYGLRHIKHDGRVNEWRPPQERTITCCYANTRQVIIALNGSELVYFELNPMGQLAELSNRVAMTVPITCLGLGEVSSGRQRFPFAMVGCADNTVRSLSLDPTSPMQTLSMQAVTSTPTSLCAVEMSNMDQVSSHGTLYLHIGLQNGVLLRTTMDQVTGLLSDTRTRFLGSRPVKLLPVKAKGKSAVLALSSRPWLSYTSENQSHVKPIAYEAIDCATFFHNSTFEEGLVVATGDQLKLIVFDKLDSSFNQVSIPLRYTPRRMLVHPENNYFVVIESEHLTYSPSEIKRLVEENGPEESGSLLLNPAAFGHPKAPQGKWASQIRVVNPFSGETTCEIELDENEAAFSVAMVKFYTHPGQLFVAVGTATKAILSPRSVESASIRMYKMDLKTNTLKLTHHTMVDDIPLAILSFQGRLLAGVGKYLRIYDLGKLKLLRKCQCKSIPSDIVSLHAQGDRIIVGDNRESVHYVAYNAPTNQLVPFADDSLPAWTSATVQLDYETTAVGDKVGNVFIARLPAECSNEIDGEPQNNAQFIPTHRLPPPSKTYLNGAAYKLDRITNFHVGDTITKLQKVPLTLGGKDLLVYFSLLGRIGTFSGLSSTEDVEFLQTLEFHMRSTKPPLSGRDHLQFRSSYIPVKATIDGDLCEMYFNLTIDQQQMIAEELDRTPNEVKKKLEDLRVAAGF